MHEMKILNAEAVPAALDKAKQYRLLGEPDDAESICLDILTVEPDNQQALVTLLLSLTDKFRHGELGSAYDRAREIITRLDEPYCKNYYAGIICERRAKYHLKKEGPGGAEASYQWFARAMAAYEKAMTDCDSKKQEAILRWNSCARLLDSNPEIRPGDAADAELLLDPFEMPH